MSNHHRIDYIELAVGELPRAKQFYTDAFGWPFTDYGPDYSGFNDGRLDGGLAAEASDVRTAPLVILYSEALEASLQQVEAAGGTIVKPIFAFPGGRRFHFTDPAGNELAVWSDR